MGRLRRASTGLLALTLLAAGGAACGDDDDGDDEAATTSSTEVEEAGPMEVTAVDYGYEDLPDSVSAGTRLTLTNASQKELHELVAFLLPEDEDRPIDEIAKLPESELDQLFAGEPAMVLIAQPSGGEMIPAVGDGTLNDAGRYAVFCAIPVGADPQAYLEAAQTSEGPPEVEGGPPHFTQGMYGEITVE